MKDASIVFVGRYNSTKTFLF